MPGLEPAELGGSSGWCDRRPARRNSGCRRLPAAAPSTTTASRWSARARARPARTRTHGPCAGTRPSSTSTRTPPRTAAPASSASPCPAGGSAATPSRPRTTTWSTHWAPVRHPGRLRGGRPGPAQVQPPAPLQRQPRAQRDHLLRDDTRGEADDGRLLLDGVRPASPASRFLRTASGAPVSWTGAPLAVRLGSSARRCHFVSTVTLPSMMSCLALSTAATTSVIALYFGSVSANPTPPDLRSARTTPDSGLPSYTDLDRS